MDPHTGRTTYTYDEMGNLRGYTLPNGVNSYYEYDGLNRLTNLTVSRAVGTLARYTYQVNAAGHRTGALETLIRDPLNPQPYTINRLYQYDQSYRLTNETITLNGQPSSLNYDYDAVGNRLNLQSSLAEIASREYGYDDNDRLLSDSYDANGNTLTAFGFTMIGPDHYDFENRLIQRTEPGKVVTILYDGDGNRVAKTVTTSSNTISTLFVMDDRNATGYAQVLEELISVDSQSATLNRVYAFGHELLSQDQLLQGTWTLRYHGLDGHGNTRILFDALGEVTDTYDYDAFGKLIAHTGSTPNQYLFTTEQFDSDLGLYFLRARYHNPDAGRLWTQDSFEGLSRDPITLHKYLYANANPVSYTDPTGHMSLAGVVYALKLATSFVMRNRLPIAFAIGFNLGYHSMVSCRFINIVCRPRYRGHIRITVHASVANG